MHVPESKRIMSLLIMLLTTSFVFAQVTVTGNVRDERGDEVIGATVLLIGSQHGVITDVDGNFKLNVPNAKTAVLQISYVGYETQKIALKGKTKISVTLAEVANALNEVMVVAYGTQKKETLTGAISSVKTDGLLRSPNASIASSLAGQVTGLSSVSTSGQPGKEDPSIYIRGVGSLTEGASSPLILVDGVERSFFQMDPNEIESVTVLKDASATAVFGVRGANGVILVTTRRGQEGKATISITSSVGVQQPTRILKMADSYTYATLFNEMNDNDGKSKHTFDDYALERFRLGDDPIMYPNMNWRKYIMKNSSIQTQHNLNISGGTDRVRYFISMGFLWQDGLFRQFKELDYNNNYSYTRYNYRGNLDLDITKSTLLKVGLGGIVGITHEPNDQDYPYGLFSLINMAQPFNSPGIIDGKLVLTDPGKYDGVLMDNNALGRYYGQGYDQATSNTMNMDLQLTQKLDFITKGLSVEVKGAYNTYYVFKQKRYGSVETYTPYYQSALESPGLDINDPSYNKTIVYRVSGQNKRLSYSEDNNTRGRDWYFEASLRYNRKFGGHNVGGLLLYNQSKKNLLKEGIDEKLITVTGNTVIDALYHVVSEIKNKDELKQLLASELEKSGYKTSRLSKQSNRKLVLITGHRRENFGNGFISMCKALKTLAIKYPDIDFVYPMHLNPNVRKPIKSVFGDIRLPNLFFIEPLEYLPFVYLMEQSAIVLTDSGGIQEEAPGLGKPVLVMRDTTERPEALDAGTVKLVGTDFIRILDETSRLIEDKKYYDQMSKAVNPYGDGLACQRIVTK